MSSVNDQIVREFFELQGFLVRQIRKHVSPMPDEVEESDFWIWHPGHEAGVSGGKTSPTKPEIRSIASAFVFVKPWHTETFTTGVIENDQDLTKRLSSTLEANDSETQSWLQHQPQNILVVSNLPKSKAAREKSMALIKEKGFDVVLTFDRILSRLLEHVERNRNYQRSDLLQTLRLLKNYELVRPLQLELFESSKPRKKRNKRPATKQPGKK